MRSRLNAFVFPEPKPARALARPLLLVLALVTSIDASSAETPASWPRWLEPGASPIAFSSRTLSGLPDTPFSVVGDSDPTRSLLGWTDQTLALIQKNRQNPQRSVRALALVHAAMYDAFVESARESSAPAAGLAAAHRATSLTLAYLYPYETTGWIEARGLALAYGWAARNRLPAPDLERALRVGERVAGDAIRQALSDGADRRTAAPPPLTSDPGRWRGTPPLNIQAPQEPLAGEWRPWVPGSIEYEAPPPPAYGSTRFWEEAEEVYRIWKGLTPEQKAVAEAWNLQAGSVTPPGVWNLKAMKLVFSQKLGPAAAARVLAALNVAMSDAAIACWRVKYRWWKVRPVTVIRERYDANFLPHLITPPHPSYVSGHSSASGAADAALSAFFPGSRPELHAYAEEAAMSRLWGGIHYRSDNVEGLRLGRTVGERVMKRALEAAPDQRAGGSTP